MKSDKTEMELDLEPHGETNKGVWDFFVPMHSDNWALASASGYIGGSLKDDAARDIQSGLGNSVVGFHGAVPDWAISHGEDGPRVIVRLTQECSAPPSKEEPVKIRGPIRITEATGVCFKDKSAIENFEASYEPFPDVATSLVEKLVDWPVSPGRMSPEDMNLSPEDGNFSRQDADFMGGFSAAIIDLLDISELDPPFIRFLSEPGQQVAENARRLLLALEPSSPTLDIEIWTATLEILRSRFGRKGFDRRDFLAEIENRIEHLGSEAALWIGGCRKVINAEIDIPSLADGDKIGRRAALGFILAQEPAGLQDLEDNLEAGQRVRALVAVAVCSFAGLSRLNANMKSPAPRMNAVLATGEAILEGKPVLIEVQSKRIANDLTRHQVVLVADIPVIEREVEPPPYLMMLKARIQEAGYKVLIDPGTGQLGILPRGPKGDLILVEENGQSTQVHPVVNLALVISTLNKRPTIQFLKGLMAGAWKHATTVALRTTGQKEEIVAIASLPLATLDRDELNFHVERLLKISDDLGPAKKKRRRVKEE